MKFRVVVYVVVCLNGIVPISFAAESSPKPPPSVPQLQIIITPPTSPHLVTFLESTRNSAAKESDQKAMVTWDDKALSPEKGFFARVDCYAKIHVKRDEMRPECSEVNEGFKDLIKHDMWTNIEQAKRARLFMV